MINAGNILTGCLPNVWYYEHYLKTSKDIDTYFASNSVFKDSYYLGKTLGDVISAGLGIGMTAKGIVDFLTGASATIGGAASAGTGIGAIIATAGAAHAAAGIAEGTAGIAVAAAAAGNFGGDFQRLQCEAKSTKNFDKLSAERIEKIYKLKRGQYHREVKPEILKDLTSQGSPYKSKMGGIGRNPDIYLSSDGQIMVVSTVKKGKALITDLHIQDYII